ncbi:hypothetical protein EDB81DRAFT_644400 [Dactylonectria macrodidyma]|uniref:Uncharacterized protein n=1 Tax=Dactylonectria macrodidyma TaxID=307937 RepID=A0A9P9FG94_9HYPO|nr:hypothetical protein EDB81DRAFT_644400 [Dactylonectria macrodidyma]
MASSNAVPSRTAIHAIRGVLLTTSCSVILLAEERRQRLKIARAAIDNAKKLHTIRVNHNSIALSESFGRRDAYPAELGGDFSTSPGPQNTIRRRRRNGQSPRDSLKAEAAEEIDSTPPSKPIASLAPEPPEKRQRRWDEWDVARKELSRMSAPKPFTHNELFLRVSTDEITTASTRGQMRRRERDALVEPLIKASEIKAQQMSQVPSQDSLAALDRLLVKLESPAADPAVVAGQLDSAIDLLGRLILSEALEPNVALSRGIRILQSVVGSREHGKMPAILHSLHPACTEICLLAVPAMDSLHAKRDTEGVAQLLHYFFQSPVWHHNDTPHDQRNTWVTRMFMHYWRKTQNFTEIKSIYRLLQDAGLFTEGFLPLLTQYSIRRRITLIALDAGDDATAKAEMKRVRQLRPKATEHDVSLRGRFVIRDASLGKWEAVWPQLQGLTIKGMANDKYQNVLSWLTKIYCKGHSPEEIDIFVRDLVATHGMVLNQPLAFLVLDRHGRKRDIQSLAGWLQFCHGSGLDMDQIFFNEIVDKCCKYWSLARVDVVHMLEGVRSFMPSVHDPHVAKYSVRGALHDLHKHLPGEVTKGDGFGMVSKLPNTSGDSFTVFERTAFRCMNTLALEKNWQQVSDTFNEASEKGIGFSSRCLRLAVIANINLEGPHSRTATRLVSKAHMDGHDISSALVPLLVARLESGDDVGTVLREALGQGAHVHDSVYNKAARILTQKGFQEGAIKVCELAAQQNGNRELAYGRFNFATLVFTYTGQRRYQELRSLLVSFTSKSEWWQGSKECKESLKRAIKTVARQSLKSHSTDQEMHEDMLMCLKLALEHIKALRATVQQERTTLTQEVVGVFKQTDHAQQLGTDYVEDEAPVKHRMSEATMSWETPMARPRNVEQLEEAVYRGGQMRNEQSKSWSGGKAESQHKAPRAVELTNGQEEIFIARWHGVAHG